MRPRLSCGVLATTGLGIVLIDDEVEMKEMADGKQMNRRGKFRIEFILDKVRGRTVLDVGCVDHEACKEEEEQWLHGLICQEAASVVGLDIEREEVEKLLARGYEVVCGDAETVDLDQRFEVCVAGELIEHLGNPLGFLRNMRRHLKAGGEIILTTPNPFYPKRLLEILVAGEAAVHPQHTTWYCPRTLGTIMRRAGFVDVVVFPFDNTERFRWLVRGMSRWRPWLSTNLLAVGRNPGG